MIELDSPGDYITSVKWLKEGGEHLAVGMSNGDLTLWDTTAMTLVRSLEGHSDRVGSLAWNSHVLSSGSRSGKIIHSDVRAPEHLIKELPAHTQEVCGLAWSTDKRLLASGGNDNVLNIWSAVGGECFSESTPKHSLT